jgi:hypothetical protein
VGARRGQPPRAKREQRVREDAWRLRGLVAGVIRVPLLSASS